MITYLISKSSTGKIRIVYLFCDEKWNDELGGYVITRTTGQYKGKMTSQPNIIISHGKAKRTCKEQLDLEYASNKKKYLDKGYKEIDRDPDTVAEAELNDILGDIKVDQNGFPKHMCAKQSDGVSEKTIDKLAYWYVSRKLDGVRGGIYWDGKEIHVASRGGGDYDCSMTQFRENSTLIDFFKNHPDAILDGEIYKHGWTLQELSGEARRCQTVTGSDDLEFWVYDIMVPNIPFEERLVKMQEFEKELCKDRIFEFTPEWEEGELRLQFLPHVKAKGLANIDKLHDVYTDEGFEGAVFRDPSKEYGFGKRDNRMLKRKKFQDAEFKIAGITEGLREEDMCFLMALEDGRTFNAKPLGSRELKQKYRQNIDKIIGKMGTVKFFYYSDDGIPTLPVFKHIRPDGE